MKDPRPEERKDMRPAWTSPVLLSLVLHGVIVAVTLMSWHWITPMEDTPEPSISARLVSPEAAATGNHGAAPATGA